MLNDGLDTFVANAREKSGIRVGRDGAFSATLEARFLREAWMSPEVPRRVRSLFVACSRGDLERVRKLLKSGVDPNPDAKPNWGVTPLHLAVPHDLVVEELLKFGADPNAKDDQGGTPLHWAATATVKGGNARSIELLVAAGAGLDARDNFLRSPLHIAAENKKNPRPLAKLLELGADVNAIDGNENTPLLSALKGSSAEHARLLFAAGADPLKPGPHGKSPLEIAWAESVRREIRRAVAAKISKDSLPYESTSFRGENRFDRARHAVLESDYATIEAGLADGTMDVDELFVFACLNDVRGVCVYLLNRGADPNAFVRADRFGSTRMSSSDRVLTPLIAALRSHVQRNDLVEILLARGADPDQTDENGRTPLALAAISNKPSIARILMAAGTDPFLRDKHGKSPLDWAHGAVLREIKSAIEERILCDELPAESKSPNMDDEELLDAARRDSVHDAIAALDAGAELDGSDEQVFATILLHRAVRSGSWRVVDLLLSRGADPNAREKRFPRKTPLMFAAGDTEFPAKTVASLVRAGADVSAKSDEGMGALSYAARCGNSFAAAALLAAGADPNEENDDGLSPLHYAAKSECGVAVIELALGAGADPLKASKNGLFPRDVARDLTSKKKLDVAAERKMLENGLPRESSGRETAARASGKELASLMNAFESKGEKALVDIEDTPLAVLLVAAVLSRYSDAVSAVLKRGADPNAAVSVEKAESLGVKRGFWTPLGIASLKWRTDDVEILLKHGADPNVPGFFDGDDSLSPLQIGCGGSDVVKNESIRKALTEAILKRMSRTVLPREQTGIDSRNAEKMLFGAAKSGNIEWVSDLIAAGADPDVRDSEGWTPLMRCLDGDLVQSALCSVSRFLLNHGASAAAKSHDGTTALHVAAARGALCAIRDLLKRDADIEGEDVHGWTPLHHASSNGKFAASKLLLELGADPFAKTADGKTAIDFARDGGTKALIESFAKRKMSAEDLPRETTSKGCLRDQAFGALKLLRHAVLRGNSALVHELLAAGVHPDTRNKRGVPVLMIACVKGHVEVVEELLSAGANTEARDQSDQTAVFAAVQSKIPKKLVKILAEHGARLNVVDKEGWTPLSFAVLIKRLDALEALLVAGADANFANQKGRVPLHVASKFGSLESVKLLLAAGAEPLVKDSDGKTPIDLAGSKGMFLELTAAAEKKMSVTGLPREFSDERRDWSAEDEMIMGAIEGDLETVERAVLAGANLNTRDEDDRTVLCSAVRHEHPEVVELLLELGADPDLAGGGLTPLCWAVRFGDSRIVKILLAHGADPLKKSCGKLPRDFEGGTAATKRLLDIAVAKKMSAEELPKEAVLRGPVLGESLRRS